MLCQELFDPVPASSSIQVDNGGNLGITPSIDQSAPEDNAVSFGMDVILYIPGQRRV